MATRDAAVKEISSKMTGMKQSLVAATNELTVRQGAVTAKANAVNQSVAAVQTAQAAIATQRTTLVDLWTHAAGVRSLKHLSPEQMGWAVMNATGVLEPQRPGADEDDPQGERCRRPREASRSRSESRSLASRKKSRKSQRLREHVCSVCWATAG